MLDKQSLFAGDQYRRIGAVILAYCLASLAAGVVAAFLLLLVSGIDSFGSDDLSSLAGTALLFAIMIGGFALLPATLVIVLTWHAGKPGRAWGMLAGAVLGFVLAVIFFPFSENEAPADIALVLLIFSIAGLAGGSTYWAVLSRCRAWGSA